jgi:IS30 family transposase
LLQNSKTTFTCDNGTEFKGEVQDLCDSLNIPTIRGRAYHPETQGSVEIANRTFKSRLYAEIMESGVRNWASRLSEIAETINTTRPSCLRAHVTPFEVWFGRPPMVQGEQFVVEEDCQDE